MQIFGLYDSNYSNFNANYIKPISFSGWHPESISAIFIFPNFIAHLSVQSSNFLLLDLFCLNAISLPHEIDLKSAFTVLLEICVVLCYIDTKEEVPMWMSQQSGIPV